MLEEVMMKSFWGRTGRMKQGTMPATDKKKFCNAYNEFDKKSNKIFLFFGSAATKISGQAEAFGARMA